MVALKQYNQFIHNEKIPKSLYKFRDWANPFHRKLLEGEIYLSSPIDFNDPFDCSISLDYQQLQSNLQIQKEYFTLIVNRHKPHLTIQQKEVEVQRLIDERCIYDTKWLDRQAKITRENYGKVLGVFCLTTNKENILLWSHYANSHRGFNVGFNVEQLFFECLNFGMGGAKVVYSKDYPSIDPREDLFLQSINQTNIKSSWWEYEQEYRLTKLYAARQTFIVSYSCFKEINLGCQIKESTRKEIINFVTRNFKGLPIYQAKTVRNKFDLTFDQIA